MNDIEKILNNIDSVIDSTKPMLKNIAKTVLEQSQKIEEGMRKDEVFVNFIANSSLQQLEDQVNKNQQMLEETKKDLFSTDSEAMHKAAFHTLMIGINTKLIQEEIDRRKKENK